MRHCSNPPDLPIACVEAPLAPARRIASRWPTLLTFVSALCWAILAGAPAASAATIVIPSGATAISAGDSDHDCAVLQDGTARCWGRNEYGELGDGTRTYRHAPVTVSGLSNAFGISIGGHHTCAVLGNGTAKCWGSNSSGELGDGTTTDSLTPVTVSGLSNAVAISVGVDDTCALLSDGTAKCWGYNEYHGQLGDGTMTNRSTPVTVSGLSNASAISTGGLHTCAVLGNGTAKCWGDNDWGQLGDGTTTDSPTPVTVSGLGNAVGITASTGTCAVLGDGTAKCWGYGRQPSGGGETVPTPTPIAVSGLSDATAISASWSHTCALLNGGTAKCWGLNEHGELGDGTTAYSSMPVAVSGLADATAIKAGLNHTCALLAGGAVECWGEYYGLRETEPPPAEPLSSSSTPPLARITSHPHKETADRRPTFAFTGEPGGTYECSVDAGAWRRCRSGEDFGPLLPGDHRFRVRETLNGLTGPADSYSWTIDLPRACVLRVARARVFVFTHQHRVRLVIHYKTYRPAKVTVAYKLLGRRGGLKLGKAASHFKTAGIFRLSERLDKRAIAKVRATRLMKVAFRIPRTPRSCGRYYAKRLTIPKKVFGQTVWFQSDSIFTS